MIYLGSLQAWLRIYTTGPLLMERLEILLFVLCDWMSQHFQFGVKVLRILERAGDPPSSFES